MPFQEHRFKESPILYRKVEALMKYVYCKYCWKGFGKVGDKCPFCRRALKQEN